MSAQHQPSVPGAHESPPPSERKIDLIDRRLEGVIRLLEDLKTNLPSAASAPTQQPPRQISNDRPNGDARTNAATTISTATATISTSSVSTPSSRALPHIPEASVVEGDSSLSAHSVFANDFLRKVVNTDSLQDASLELRETLDSLYHIVNALKQPTASSETTYPHARKPSHRPSSRGSFEMPPIEKAVAMIRLAKC